MDALIVGFGAIGCRHAQSLLSSGRYGRICVVEPSDTRFDEGLTRIGATATDLIRYHGLGEFREKADIAIVATSSEPRFGIMKDLIALGIPLFLVEKIVFQSLRQFDECIALLETAGAKAYCNFTNRYISNYRELKNRIAGHHSPFSMSVTGGDLGLGSNVIHYMDLFEYLTGEPLTHADSDLNVWDKENKRGSNYREFSGLITAGNGSGDLLTIYFDPSHQGGVVIHLEFEGKSMILSEGAGVELSSWNGDIVKRAFSIIPTSRLTNRIIEDMNRNACPLTTVAETRNAHALLFSQVYRALNLAGNEDTLCPVT